MATTWHIMRVPGARLGFKWRSSVVQDPSYCSCALLLMHHCLYLQHSRSEEYVLRLCFNRKALYVKFSVTLPSCDRFDCWHQRELFFVFTVTCMEFMEQQSRAVLMQGTNRHRHSICEECIVNLTMMAHTLLAWMRNVPSSFVIRIRFYDTMIVCPCFFDWLSFFREPLVCCQKSLHYLFSIADFSLIGYAMFEC